MIIYDKFLKKDKQPLEYCLTIDFCNIKSIKDKIN